MTMKMTTEVEKNQPNPIIDAVTEADLEAIELIEVEAFYTPWHIESFSDALTRPYALFLALRIDGRLVGYSLSWLITDELHILKIAVLKSLRRQGLGDMLLERTIADAVKRGATVAWLEVRPSNAAALALYKNRGFVEAYVRKKYYTDTGEDAIILLSQLYHQGKKSGSSLS